jgi:hypothetical protein
MKSNSQWDELVALTTKLVMQCGGRVPAFKAACEQRPDLASAAIDPMGQPVIKGSNVAPQPQPSESTNPAGKAQPWSAVLKSLGCLNGGK